MRPIKFRVWVFESDIKKGYMLDIYEKFEKDYNSDYYLVYEDFRDLEDGRCKFCIPLQFTGLHDKNCKEIYEGDILEDTLGRKKLVEYFQDGFWLNASFDGAEWCLRQVNSSSKIIGNIYENTELLEKKFAD